MFLRRYTRTKDGKTHTYYALVESVRTEAGPRQHVVAYLGELNQDQERRIVRIARQHLGTTLATHRRLSQPTGRRPTTPPLP